MKAVWLFTDYKIESIIFCALFLVFIKRIVIKLVENALVFKFDY